MICDRCGLDVATRHVTSIHGPFLLHEHHRAPCGRWCLGGGIGLEQQREHGSLGEALCAAHRHRDLCPTCKPVRTP